jgi:hypothetical protein
MLRTESRPVSRIPAAVPVRVLRAGLGLAVAASLLAFAGKLSAQQATPPISIRPVIGAIVGTGDQRASRRREPREAPRATPPRTSRRSRIL